MISSIDCPHGKSSIITGSVLALLLAAGGNPQRSVAVGPTVIEFYVDDEPRRGLPIMDFASELVVLDRDGQIHALRGAAKENVRDLKLPYEPANPIETRDRLQSEFGRDFEIVATQHFLVVQPRGRGDRWPDLFERSHRSFVNYMSRRGVKIRRGRFPMVAVVMPDASAMYAEMERAGIQATSVAGVYERESNRVITHDGGHLEFIAATVRHEAAHQSAYNYNVHSRVVITPRWVTEGIGQLFEPEAMVMNQAGLTLRDRVNRDSLRKLKENFDGGQSDQFSQAVRDLIGTDEMFNNAQTTADAYAVAWAMMFYLAEREPKNFARLLTGTNGRGTYQPYDRFARLNDFERWVGSDVDTFAKKVAWFLKSL
ncbi:DUF1570 domain-containing protein [Roseiconus nitratireducens]|uniref:DUF1570 domain-containing protein n=1 Tax=Roseiconus nitratireducens TaxID=2605748 RepID=A0A5M6CUD1_9BACT|nr:DUF1570 domain-containing protein [Roseiconus nitratireducens]KAA5538868.1 DUF1570 domain-containing protein [Roseiconus nitratireducens]